MLGIEITKVNEQGMSQYSYICCIQQGRVNSVISYEVSQILHGYCGIYTSVSRTILLSPILLETGVHNKYSAILDLPCTRLSASARVHLLSSLLDLSPSSAECISLLPQQYLSFQLLLCSTCLIGAFDMSLPVSQRFLDRQVGVVGYVPGRGGFELTETSVTSSPSDHDSPYWSSNLQTQHPYDCVL